MCNKTTQILFILLMLFCSTAVYGDSKQACQDKVENTGWSLVEEFVWEKICAGETADLDEHEGNQLVSITKKTDPNSNENKNTSLSLCKIHITDYDGSEKNENKNKDEHELDPTSKGWNDNRKISPGFLKDILLNESLVSNIQSSGITIKGAYFKEEIKLQNARINFPLRIESSFFESEVNLNSINITGAISFDYSYFKEKFRMKSAAITGDLSMKMANFENVTLTNATIRDNLDITGAKANKVTGLELEMDSITVGDDIVMCGVTGFNSVDLEAAHIGGTVYMTGARVGRLEMGLITIDDDLLMRYGAEFKEIDLSRAHIGGSLDMTQAKVYKSNDDKSNFLGKLDMDSIAIGGNLLLRELPECESDNCLKLNLQKYTPQFSEVDLHGAHISGRMSLTGTILQGKLNMDSIFIREDLHMREAEFKDEVILTNADIGDELSMSCSTFLKLLDMDSINVGTDLIMNNAQTKKNREKNNENDSSSEYLCNKSPTFSNITLENAVIGQSMEIIGANEGKQLSMNLSNISGNLKIMGGSFETIALQYIQINQNLDFEDAKIISQIDLTGASIQNVLNLNLDSKSFKIDSGKVNEGENIALKLRNASANVFLMPDLWPKIVDLNGFKYQKIENKKNNPDALLEGLLERLSTIKYTPQPYVQFASVLRDMGYKSLATKVIVAKMNHKQKQAWDQITWDLVPWTWIKLSVFKYSIKYGYGYYYSLAWVLVLVVIGAILIRIEQNQLEVKDEKLDSFIEELFYSTNMLLPIIQLNKRHEEINHNISFVRYYFYLHKVMGYVLAMSLIAGLSGMLAPEGF